MSNVTVLGGENLNAWYDGIVDVGASIVKAVTSKEGQKVTASILTTAGGLMTPTQKANLANAQAAAGITPQAISGNNAQIQIPVSGSSNTLPLVLGAAALVGVMTLIFLKR